MDTERGGRAPICGDTDEVRGDTDQVWRGNVMGQLIKGLGSFALAVVIGVAGLMWLGVVDLRFPWSVDPLSETREMAFGDTVEVVGVEPITLDCRARITAQVPVKGRKEHRIVGQVYRTDTVEMSAIGDIDTCVDATAVEVLVTSDGATRVRVPAAAIRFERPRVDAVATMGSVEYDKGLLGKITDAFPWVDDAEGLTAAGYAFAQETIGSSECMEAAYDKTVAAITDAYRRQAQARGHDPDDVTVTINGTPVFDQQAPSQLGEFDFDVTDRVECAVSTGVAGERPQT